VRITRDTIIGVIRAFNLSLTEEELEELNARLILDEPLINILEFFDDVSTVPALKPSWGLPNGSMLVPTPHSLTNKGSAIPGFRQSKPRLSPREAVERSLEAIESNPDAHVFIRVFDERALSEARELEKLGKRVRSNLPLWGMTVAVKDLISIAGHRMTGGSRALRREVADKDACVVERLRHAGAVVIGAANLHELGFGSTSENPHFGWVANPLDRSRIAGGSSGGSAAAVGFGMATIGIGTDTGGSVRNPAACCGIVGLKPSFNLVPLDGVLPLSYTLDHIGPLTMSVAEAALVLEVLTNRPGAYTSNLEGSLRELKIGVPKGYFVHETDPSVRRAYKAVLEMAKAFGAELIPVVLPHHSIAPAVYLGTTYPEAVAIHYRTVLERGSVLGRDVYIRLLEGFFIPAFARIKAQQRRELMFREIHKAFQSVDVLATPTFPIMVPVAGTSTVKIGEETRETRSALMRNTCPFNMTGVPALTLPFTDNAGIPVSLQLIGPYGMDDVVLKVGRTLERELLERTS
jgi:aspartyl-tRNA(Asn)/glutamyl-tRNA(Gln) amidotransferase subunit A